MPKIAVLYDLLINVMRHESFLWGCLDQADWWGRVDWWIGGAGWIGGLVDSRSGLVDWFSKSNRLASRRRTDYHTNTPTHQHTNTPTRKPHNSEDRL